MLRIWAGQTSTAAHQVGLDIHTWYSFDVTGVALAGLTGRHSYSRYSCCFVGVADHYALDDEHALAITRSIVRNLNVKKKVSVRCGAWLCSLSLPLVRYSAVSAICFGWRSLSSKHSFAPCWHGLFPAIQLNTSDSTAPLYDPAELYGIVGTNLQRCVHFAQPNSRISHQPSP